MLWERAMLAIVFLHWNEEIATGGRSHSMARSHSGGRSYNILVDLP